MRQIVFCAAAFITATQAFLTIPDSEKIVTDLVAALSAETSSFCDSLSNPKLWRSEEHSCFHLMQDLMSWSDAWDACRSLPGPGAAVRGRLAHLPTDELMTRMLGWVNGRSADAWVGFRQGSAEGSEWWSLRSSYVWVDGEKGEVPVSCLQNFTSIGDGDLKMDRLEEECGYIKSDGKGKDLDCEELFRPLCEFVPVNHSMPEDTSLCLIDLEDWCSGTDKVWSPETTSCFVKIDNGARNWVDHADKCINTTFAPYSFRSRLAILPNEAVLNHVRDLIMGTSSEYFVGAKRSTIVSGVPSVGLNWTVWHDGPAGADYHSCNQLEPGPLDVVALSDNSRPCLAIGDSGTGLSFVSHTCDAGTRKRAICEVLPADAPSIGDVSACEDVPPLDGWCAGHQGLIDPDSGHCFIYFEEKMLWEPAWDFCEAFDANPSGGRPEGIRGRLAHLKTASSIPLIAKDIGLGANDAWIGMKLEGGRAEWVDRQLDTGLFSLSACVAGNMPFTEAPDESGDSCYRVKEKGKTEDKGCDDDQKVLCEFLPDTVPRQVETETCEPIDWTTPAPPHVPTTTPDPTTTTLTTTTTSQPVTTTTAPATTTLTTTTTSQPATTTNARSTTTAADTTTEGNLPTTPQDSTTPQLSTTSTLTTAKESSSEPTNEQSGPSSTPAADTTTELSSATPAEVFPSLALTFDDCEARVDSQVYNGDCFVVLDSALGKAGFEATCGPDGFPALPFWVGAIADLSTTALASGCSPHSAAYVGLYRMGPGPMDALWYWQLPADRISTLPQGREYAAWSTNQPNNHAPENPSYWARALGNSGLHDEFLIQECKKVMCQFEGPKNTTEMSHASCSLATIGPNGGAAFHKGTCLYLHTAYVLRADQAFEDWACPAGTLLVSSGRMPFLSAQRMLAAYSPASLGLVSLRQVGGQTAVGDGWQWRKGDGSVQSMAAGHNVWAHPPTDDGHHSGNETGDQDFGFIAHDNPNGVITGASIAGKLPQYPICQIYPPHPTCFLPVPGKMPASVSLPIRSIGNTNEYACGNECNAEPQCRGFKINPVTGDCTIYGDVGFPLEVDLNVVFYFHTFCDETPNCLYNLTTGKQFKSGTTVLDAVNEWPVADELECKGLCSQLPSCAAYQYFDTDRICSTVAYHDLPGAFPLDSAANYRVGVKAICLNETSSTSSVTSKDTSTAEPTTTTTEALELTSTEEGGTTSLLDLTTSQTTTTTQTSTERILSSSASRTTTTSPHELTSTPSGSTSTPVETTTPVLTSSIAPSSSAVESTSHEVTTTTKTEADSTSTTTTDSLTSTTRRTSTPTESTTPVDESTTPEPPSSTTVMDITTTTTVPTTTERPSSAADSTTEARTTSAKRTTTEKQTTTEPHTTTEHVTTTEMDTTTATSTTKLETTTELKTTTIETTTEPETTTELETTTKIDTTTEHDTTTDYETTYAPDTTTKVIMTTEKDTTTELGTTTEMLTTTEYDPTTTGIQTTTAVETTTSSAALITTEVPTTTTPQSSSPPPTTSVPPTTTATPSTSTAYSSTTVAETSSTAPTTTAAPTTTIASTSTEALTTSTEAATTSLAPSTPETSTTSSTTFSSTKAPTTTEAKTTTVTTTERPTTTERETTTEPSTTIGTTTRTSTKATSTVVATTTEPASTSIPPSTPKATTTRPETTTTTEVSTTTLPVTTTKLSETTSKTSTSIPPPPTTHVDLTSTKDQPITTEEAVVTTETTDPDTTTQPIINKNTVKALEKLLEIPGGISPSVLKALEKGNPAPLIALMEKEGVRPNPEEWNDLKTSDGFATLPDPVKEALVGYEAGHLPQGAVDQLEDFAGTPLPEGIKQELDKGNTKPLTQWMDKAAAEPTEEQWAQLEKAAEAGVMPKEILDDLKAWEEDKKLSPEAVDELNNFAEMEVPRRVIDAMDEGNLSAFTDWLEDEEIRLTRNQLARLKAGEEVFGFPEGLPEEVEQWAADRWLKGAVSELGKFAGKEVPEDVVKEAEQGRSQPFIDWLEKEAIEPSPSDLLRFKARHEAVAIPDSFADDVLRWFDKFSHVFTTSPQPTTGAPTERSLAPGETTTPPFPLSPAEEVAASIMQSMGCAALIGILAATLVGYAVLVRDPSIERFIHMNQELSLLLAHILVLAMRDRVSLHVPCKLVAVALQSLFLTSFSFMAIEAFHAYSISSSLIPSGGLMNKKQFAALGWILPAVYSGSSAMLAQQHYKSFWSCWLNMGHQVALASFVPAGLLAGAAVVMVEAGGMDAERALIDGFDPTQRTAAMANQKGLLFVLPTALASWAVGSYAVFAASVPLYGTVAALNLALALAIFAFHTLGNPKVLATLRRFLPCL